jgi:hypothetical protein
MSGISGIGPGLGISGTGGISGIGTPNLLADGITTSLADKGAEGNTTLNQKQAAAVLGAPLPIVFCRRVTSGSITSGGVLISPPATECRFENDTSNTLTAYYRLLLSEGRLAGVQIRDVFQVSCRVGTHAQAYNGPAGSWTAGNAMVDRAGYTEQECPTICGGGGNYLDISSLSFQCSYPNGDTTWDQQVHVFVRNGIEVPRLLDGVTGPSNNLADLMVLAMKRSSRVPDRSIDSSNLLAAAKFLDVNGLRFDGVIAESKNLQDFLYGLAPLFLLRVTRSNGKYGLRPLLPTTSTGAINTSAIDWTWQFTENELLERFELNWIPLVDRRPYCSVMTWRQQPDDDLGVIRTIEYRSNQLAEDGPYEATDLSGFCTTENHAIKIAAYEQARRAHVTHTLGIALKPGPWSANLSQGDIVRVTVPRRAIGDGTTWHDYLYEVGQVTYGNDGEISLGLIHFPIDTSGRSLVALAVSAAAGSGALLSTGRTGPSCDTNSSTSTSALSVTTGQGEGSYEEQAVNYTDEQKEGDPGGGEKDSGGSGSPGNNDDPTVDSEGGQIASGGAPFPLSGYTNFEFKRVMPAGDTETLIISVTADTMISGVESRGIYAIYDNRLGATVTSVGVVTVVISPKAGGSSQVTTVFPGRTLSYNSFDDSGIYTGPQPSVTSSAINVLGDRVNTIKINTTGQV